MSAPLFTFALASVNAAAPVNAAFTVSLPQAQTGHKLGRVRVYLSKNCKPSDPPPRAQCSDNQETAQVFGVDTPSSGLAPGSHVVVTHSTLGYPRASLDAVPPGAYCAQADLFLYSHYTRGDGFNVTLPTSCVSDAGGDGAYGSPAGTLFSDIVSIHVGPAAGAPIDLPLTHAVPQVDSPGCSGKGVDTEWIKTVRVPSARLSQFWGTPITLEACVLLPWGFDDHPTARYPLLIAHGHYSATFTCAVAGLDPRPLCVTSHPGCPPFALLGSPQGLWTEPAAPQTRRTL